MNIQFDPEGDALYVQLSQGEVVDSETIEPDIVYDYDVTDQIIGIEVLRVGANLPDLATKAFPFHSLAQQMAFLNFLETIADADLRSKLLFAKQVVTTQA